MSSCFDVAVAAIQELFPDNAGLVEWAKSASEMVSLVESENNHFSADDPVEVCEIYRYTGTGSISFDGGLESGVCQSGHKFNRWGITFLAIQDPGISKYCIRCGKAFLCIEKLETDDGPSVAKALLKQHDLCPYCQGYFRD